MGTAGDGSGAGRRGTGKRPAKPKRKRGLSNIYPTWDSGNRRWYWRAAIKRDGTLHWGRNCNTFTQEDAAKDAEGLRARHQRVHRTEGGDVTILQAFEKTLKKMEAKGDAEPTIVERKRRFNRFLKLLDGNRLLAELTPDHIREFTRRRQKNHGVGSNTIIGDLVILSHAFAANGYEDHENPARKVERPRKKKPARRRVEMETLGELLRQMRLSDYENSAADADVVEFLAITGLRNYEASRLRLDNYDQEERRLYVDESKSMARSQEFQDDEDHDLVLRVLQRAVDGPFLKPSGITSLFTRWQKRLGKKHFTARVMRRSNATDLHREEKVDLAVIQAHLGHSNIKTTMDYLDVDTAEVTQAGTGRRKRLREGMDRG